ncbi:MAG: DUF6797 domain-containing protein [Chthoniobacteraceae bacterium]
MPLIRTLACLAAIPSLAFAADYNAAMGDVEKQIESNWVDARWQKTDVGPFLSGTILTPGRTTPKGLVIKIGPRSEAAFCFDTDLLRMSAAWTGGFLKVNPARYGIAGPLAIEGEIVTFTDPAPGWANGAAFDDPRPRPYGPLPRRWAKWGGLHLHNDRVVLDYTVGTVAVRESPWAETLEGLTAITRTLEIGPSKEPMVVRVSSTPGSNGLTAEFDGVRLLTFSDGNEVTAVAAIGAEVTAEGDEARVIIAPHADSMTRAKVLLWKGEKDALKKFAALVKASPPPEDLSLLERPGERHWGEPLVTKGQLGTDSGGFAYDTLTMPYENPWHALLFASGHDFFSNGDAALCTVHGDVWRVGGIDETLGHLTWQRMATGLFQPLGLKIVDDKVHVLGRDQITILEDLNDDGETDFYRNFNNDVEVDAGGHGYATCLETDADGNFYTLRCASGTPHGGTLLRIAPDGSKLEVVATGFRNPNGLGIGPDGTITVADQEGEWVPSTRLDVIKPGGFYGYLPMHHRPETPASYDPPLCWLPKSADSSAASQVWIPETTWGFLAGRMLHLSYGRGTMLLVLRDGSSAQPQGGVFTLPGRFLSGPMRGHFRSQDGQLYVCGLRGWQTAALRDGSFQRVRCFPEKVHVPLAIDAHENGLRVTFSDALAPATANDTGSYDVQRWNYRWAERYGSKDWSVANPKKEGRDTLEITSARLSADGHSVFLTVSDLAPVMQMKLRYSLRTASGQNIRGEIDHTIHTLAPAGAP